MMTFTVQEFRLRADNREKVMNISRPISLRIAVTVLVVALVVAIPTQANARECFEHLSTRNYSAWNCGATPDIDRVFRMQTITWNDHDYLFLDEGNEIRFFNIDNPQNPVPDGSSDFRVPNIGDSDYDMVSFSVCDDCRYGIANFKAATVLFDLGTDSTPIFGAQTKNDQATQVWGGYTFSHGGQQYLVAASLGSAPCSNNTSGLYQFNGVDEAGNPLLQCLDSINGPPQIANGLEVEGTNPPIFYMSDEFDRFNIYRVRTSPTFGLDDMGNGGIVRANMERGHGVSVDEAAGLMAVASFGDLMIYDIGSNSGSPIAPVLLSSMDLAQLPTANAVALRFPVVHVGKQYSDAPPLTFDVSIPTNPVPLDQGFWDPEKPPNNLGICVWNNHATFSDDGTAMYLSRYSAFQVIDPTECMGWALSVNFVWAPTSPDIGQWTGFQITGVPAADIEQAVWQFGGTGCDGTTSYTCVEPHFPSCDVAAIAYDSGGSKTVTLIVTTTGGVQQPQVQHTLTVQNTGSCGGTSCTYSVSPTTRIFPSAGGPGTFSVTTQPGCSWSASENASWITITSGQSGNGSGSVGYQVSANTGPTRSSTITVQGRTHTVYQDELLPLVFEDGFESGDTSAWGTTAPPFHD